MWLPQSPVNPKLCGTSHSPPVRVLSPLFFLAKPLLLLKPRGKKEHPKATWSSLLLQNHTVLSYSLHQSCVILSLLPPKPHGPSSGTAATPRFKSQSQSSSAAPFPTPPTISYTCQHYLFFQVNWVAIVSLGRRGPMAWSQSSPSSHIGAVTTGALPPSYILGGSHSQIPDSEHPHSYLTYL